MVNETISLSTYKFLVANMDDKEFASHLVITMNLLEDCFPKNGAIEFVLLEAIRRLSYD